jgi:hypothetical protein
MNDINNSNEYDAYLVRHSVGYMVTQFLGRGQYNKTEFDTIDQANQFVSKVKESNPNARVMVYGLSMPPHATKPISIAIN